MNSCLLQKDYHNDTTLHVSARSKSSGFARLFVSYLKNHEEGIARVPQGQEAEEKIRNKKGNRRKNTSSMRQALRLLDVDPQRLIDGSRETDLEQTLTFVKMNEAVGNKILRFLIEKADDESVREARNGREDTPLLVAADHGRTGTVQFLIEKGTDFTQSNWYNA